MVLKDGHVFGEKCAILNFTWNANVHNFFIRNDMLHTNNFSIFWRNFEKMEKKLPLLAKNNQFRNTLGTSAQFLWFFKTFFTFPGTK